MAKANIAMLHYTAQPVVGGVENVISEHARVFAGAGYRVRVIVGRGDVSEKGYGETIVIPEMDSENGRNRDVAEALERGDVPRTFRELESAIRRAIIPALRDVDVLVIHNVLNYHFNMPLTAALCRLVETRQAPPTIAWCHDISRYVNPESGAEQRFGFPWDLLRTYYPAIRYVAVSQQRQKALAETMGVARDGIRVIPNGVSPELLLGLSDAGWSLIREHDILAADIVLLMPVRITQAKNIEFALQVTAALKDEGLVPRLIVTGPPDPHSAVSWDYFQALLSMRSELGLQAEAIFLYEGLAGSEPVIIGPRGMGEFYRIADIVFMPSHREGFGLPILEAGLLDRAIFARPVPAVEDIGMDAVHLIEPADTPQQVATRMHKWANEDIEHRLRRRVRREYTWQGIFKREIEPLIAECLQDRKERA